MTEKLATGQALTGENAAAEAGVIADIASAVASCRNAVPVLRALASATPEHPASCRLEMSSATPFRMPRRSSIERLAGSDELGVSDRLRCGRNARLRTSSKAGARFDGRGIRGA